MTLLGPAARTHSALPAPSALPEPLLLTYTPTRVQRERVSLRSGLDPLPELERLGALPEAEWQRLIDTYVLHTPCAAVVGVPSAAKAKALAAETEELTRAQRLRIGHPPRAQHQRQLALRIPRAQRRAGSDERAKAAFLPRSRS